MRTKHGDLRAADCGVTATALPAGRASGENRHYTTAVSADGIGRSELPSSTVGLGPPDRIALVSSGYESV